MKIYNSRFKQLIVSGCSFTHNNHSMPCTWPNVLASWAGWDIANLAMPGAGNTHIKNSVILYLEKTKPRVNDTLIIVMWTGPERIDWITDRNRSNFKSQYPQEYRYTEQNESTVGGSWWATAPRTQLSKTLVEYSKFQSNSSLALNSWLQIQDLENYLKINGYNYYFTSWFDYRDTVDGANRWIDFGQELDNLSLSLDQTQWIPEDPASTLGQWIHNHPEFQLEDKFHPDRAGHEAWTKEILVPELIKKNVLNEYTT